MEKWRCRRYTTAREKQTETPKHKLELIATIIIAGELKVLPTLLPSVNIESCGN